MGLALSSRGWSDLPGRLADRFRVVVFDNRGTGRSARPPGFFSMAHMADDAARVLDAANIDRAHVFGVSMGGMIAQELALRHSQRVRTLALGCTYASWLRSRRPSFSVVRDLLDGIFVRRRASRLRLASVLVSAEVLANESGRFVDWMKRAEPAAPLVTALQMAAVFRHATEARLPTIATPTLVITGDGDRLIPPENSRRLAHLIPGSKLVELRGAGHCFPFEQPIETTGVLTNFWDASGTSGASEEPVPCPR